MVLLLLRVSKLLVIFIGSAEPVGSIDSLEPILLTDFVGLREIGEHVGEFAKEFVQGFAEFEELREFVRLADLKSGQHSLRSLGWL